MEGNPQQVLGVRSQLKLDMKASRKTVIQKEQTNPTSFAKSATLEVFMTVSKLISATSKITFNASTATL